MGRSRVFLTFALSCLLAAAATTASAADGMASSSGSGADEASACQAAKNGADLAVGSQLQREGESGRYRITGFSAYQCSRSADADDNLATRLVAWRCTVNVDYVLTGE